MTKFILICLVMMSSFVAKADPIKCDLMTVLRCLCPAAMQMSCAGFSDDVFLSDKALANSITFNMKSADGIESKVTVAQPKSAARTYYTTNPEKLPEVQSALKAMGKTFGATDTLTLKSVELSSTMDLFKDSKGTQKIEASGDMATCSYVSVVRKLTYEGTPRCAAYIHCKQGTGSSICSLQDGVCPGADECANDQSVDVATEVVSKMLCQSLDDKGKIHPVRDCSPQGTVASPASANSAKSNSGGVK